MGETDLIKVKKTYDDSKTMMHGVTRNNSQLLPLLKNASPQAITNYSINAVSSKGDATNPDFIIEFCPDVSGGAGKYTIRLQLSDLVAINPSPSNIDIKFREIQICQGGQTKKMIILASDTYT
jgi:hypothetical protein